MHLLEIFILLQPKVPQSLLEVRARSQLRAPVLAAELLHC